MIKGENYEANKYKDITELAREMRSWIKKNLPALKVSVRTSKYAGGKSLSITIKESTIKLTKDASDIDWHLQSMKSNGYTANELKALYDPKNMQINQFHIDTDYRLTNDGLKLIKKLIDFVESYNMDDSDIQSDYFHTNFYSHYAIELK